MNRFTAGVLTISDKGSEGQRIDASGEYILKLFKEWDTPVACYKIIPDDEATIAETLTSWADSGSLDLIITTGGTGMSPRDVTPEATRSIIEKEIPGIAEIMRMDGFRHTPTAILSRAVAGWRGRCLIINLPGNPRAVEEYLDLLKPIIPHAIDTIQGRIGDHNKER